MKLKTKTLLVISAVCSIFFIVMTSLLHIIVMGSYSTLEENMVSDQITRMLNQFQQEFYTITQMSYDWSTWNDTYTFVEDKNDEYIQANLQYESFKDININFMFFYNQSNGLVFSKVYDFSQENKIYFPDSLYSLIDEKNEIFLHQANYSNNYQGFLLYNKTEEPLLISITPIVHSNKDGPIHGKLITGRFLNQERIDYFKEINQLSINVYPLSNDTPLLSPNQITSLLENRFFIQPINTTYIVGYTVIDDIFGNPLLLQVGSNREIYNQGLAVLQNQFIFLFITTFFLVITTIFILDKFVTSRLAVFSKSLGEIQDYQDLSKHIVITGDDEVSALGKNINIMLTSI